MKKRILSAFMALALCLTLLPAPAWAEEADAPEGGAPAADEPPAVQSEPAPQAAVQAAEVSAENAVAQVGNVNYANITDAFAAVKKNGGTLTLLADCRTPNTNERFDISGNYTLDLNSCTLTGQLYLSETSTSLTVKDSGTGGKSKLPAAGRHCGPTAELSPSRAAPLSHRTRTRRHWFLVIMMPAKR